MKRQPVINIAVNCGLARQAWANKTSAKGWMIARATVLSPAMAAYAMRARDGIDTRPCSASRCAERRRARALACASVFAFALLALAPRAHARALPATVVMHPHAQPSAGEAKAYERVMSALRELHIAEVQPEPPLDLEAVQLALDCMDESARCLREVAKRSGARVVLAPSFTQRAGSYELSILYYDSEGDEAPRRAARRQAGAELAQATIDALPAMLRELFGVEASSGSESAAEPEASPTPAAPAEPASAPASEARKLPLGPLILGGVGVAAVIAGIAVGAAMESTQHDYASRMVTTAEQAASADAARKRGESQALAANVLLGVGAAAILAGGVWLASGLVKHADEPAQASVAPMLGFDRAGLSVSGTWEALR